VKHIGIRPTYDLATSWMSHQDSEDEDVKFYKKRYFEKYPDGGGRYWNERTLTSGCGKEVCGVKENGLIYCEFCDEWFNSEQFES